MLQKPNANPCQLPMSYLGTSYPGEGYQIQSDTVTEFTREPQEIDKEKFHFPWSWQDTNIYGDKKMYEWVRQNGLFEEPHLTWRPLQDKDICLAVPDLHRAILSENHDKVVECLDRGDDINESDSEGSTAVHLTIKEKLHKQFILLLERGALLRLSNQKDYRPLHLAALFDTEGQFVQALVDKGAKVNTKARLCTTALTFAIGAKNLKAIEILVKAKAKISDKDLKDLKDLTF